MSNTIGFSNDPGDFWSMQSWVYDQLVDCVLARTAFSDEELQQLEFCGFGGLGISFNLEYEWNPQFAIRLRDAVIDSAALLANEIAHRLDGKPGTLSLEDRFVDPSVLKIYRNLAEGLRRWQPESTG